MGSFADGALAGRPAVTRHQHGAGVAWYLGTRPSPPAMRALFDRIRADAGVEPVLPNLPDAVQATIRRGAEHAYLFLLNHGAAPATVTLPSAGVDLLGDAGVAVDAVELEPRGVAVVRTRLVRSDMAN
jgi:beta-galactosidase